MLTVNDVAITLFVCDGKRQKSQETWESETWLSIEIRGTVRLWRHRKVYSQWKKFLNFIKLRKVFFKLNELKLVTNKLSFYCSPPAQHFFFNLSMMTRKLLLSIYCAGRCYHKGKMRSTIIFMASKFSCEINFSFTKCHVSNINIRVPLGWCRMRDNNDGVDQKFMTCLCFSNISKDWNSMTK